MYELTGYKADLSVRQAMSAASPMLADVRAGLCPGTHPLMLPLCCRHGPDYGFEYSDEEEQDEQDVDIENQYYNSKGEPQHPAPSTPHPHPVLAGWDAAAQSLGCWAGLCLPWQVSFTSWLHAGACVAAWVAVACSRHAGAGLRGVKPWRRNMPACAARAAGER